MTAVWLVPVVLLVTAAVVVAVAGWFASERLLGVSDTSYEPTLHVLTVDDDRVGLPRTAHTSRPGTYGIRWPGGHAVVGEILDGGSHMVVRRLARATPGLAPGLAVRWTVFVHVTDPADACGLPFEEVTVPGELGPLPAWLVPGPRSTWVLLVHGLGADRTEALRVLPTFVELGLPSLVVTYRNDVGAPRSPDGYRHLGDTEWRDLAAAVEGARAWGARDVILVGWSLGGGIIENYLHRAPAPVPVRAVVLDAPMLDWPASIAAQVRRLHMPSWFTRVLMTFVSCKAAVRFSGLDHRHRLADRTVPTLLFHGGRDVLVPVAASDTFARSRPDLVEYHRSDLADHTESWNQDPVAYLAALREFVRRVLSPDAPEAASTTGRY